MSGRSYKPYAKGALIMGAVYTYARVAWVMGALYMGDCIGESIERGNGYTVGITADAERGQYNVEGIGKIERNLERILTEKIRASSVLERARERDTAE